MPRSPPAALPRAVPCALRFIRGVLACMGLVLALAAHAASIDVGQVRLDPTDEGYAVNADFKVELSPRIEEALQSGVALYFNVEFELVRPRWYWFDERTVVSRLQYRLTYHPLSRQYRLWTGNLHQPFQTLDEALRVLGRVRGWVVLERDQVSPERSYEAGVRMRLDTAQLPKPFQLTAITNRDWALASDWKRFNFTPAPAPVVTRNIEGPRPPAEARSAFEGKPADAKAANDARPAP